MNEQDKEIAAEVARQIYNQMMQNGQALACDGSPIDAPCADVLFSPFTIEDFLRSGQTEINVVGAGVVPVVPGATATLEQASHPGWTAGCINIAYRLANNGTNHSDIRFDFFVDGTALDRPLFGSNIYDNNNGMIGDGWHPLPLQGRKQCCIGAMNKLRVVITHQGIANQLEQPRIIVQHGKRSCCSGCAADRGCQVTCSGEKPKARFPNFNGMLNFQANFQGNGNGGGGGQIPPPIPQQAPPGHVLVQGAGGVWYAVPANKMLAAAAG